MSEKLDFRYYKAFAAELATGTQAVAIHEAILFEKENFYDSNPLFLIELLFAIRKSYSALTTKAEENEKFFYEENLYHWSSFSNPSLQCAYDVASYLYDEEEQKESYRLLKGKIQVSDVEEIKRRIEITAEKDSDGNRRWDYRLWVRRYNKVIQPEFFKNESTRDGNPVIHILIDGQQDDDDEEYFLTEQEFIHSITNNCKKIKALFEELMQKGFCYFENLDAVLSMMSSDCLVENENKIQWKDEHHSRRDVQYCTLITLIEIISDETRVEDKSLFNFIDKRFVDADKNNFNYKNKFRRVIYRYRNPKEEKRPNKRMQELIEIAKKYTP